MGRFPADVNPFQIATPVLILAALETVRRYPRLPGAGAREANARTGEGRQPWRSA
jgi:hypothetical protein